MKRRTHSPILLTSVFASMLLVSAASTVSARGIYQEYSAENPSQPAVAVLMQGLSHRVYPWDCAPDREPELTRLALADGPLSALYPADVLSGPHGSPNPGSAAPEAHEPDASGSAGINTTADESAQPHPTDTEGSPDQAASDPAPPAPQEPIQYQFTEVTQDYFDDALIIGDSRAVGIQLYSGWDNITYYAESGMTVYNMFKRKITLKDGTESTIEDALRENSFGKIYLEIGINEMGTGTVDSFMEAYEDAVSHLRELQPDADIFLCGIMYVRKSKSDSDPIFNNPGIRERNDRIAQLADQNSIFYLDINEVTSDETGSLNPDYTWDEVHLLGKYNVIWTQYLSCHGICKTSPEQGAPQQAAQEQ